MFLIPWFAFFTLWAVLYRYGWGVRLSFLAAQVINGFLIVFVTETLSVFQTLTFWPLAAFWSLVLLVNVILLYRLRQRPFAVLQPLRLDAIEIAILIAVGFIVVVTGLIALVAPPNSIDSMVYHMGRVAHWKYNGTIANYPTSIMRQLVYPPFAEFVILQTCILSGSERIANLVQWNSMLATLVGVSLIAELLGGSRRTQFFAVFLVATLPMGILQSSSTQNDYVSTFSVVCVAVFALLLIITGRWRWGILGALSFGTAFLTKGIAVMVGAPFVIWALWKVPWKIGHKIALVLGGIMLVLAINAAFLCRLTALAPDPFKAMTLAAYDIGEAAVVVDSVDIRGLVSNAVCGLATELAAPFTAWNQGLSKGVEWMHHWLGLDISDPRFSTLSSKFSIYYRPSTEVVATSFLHSFFYMLVLVGVGFVAICRCFFGGGRGAWALFYGKTADAVIEKAIILSDHLLFFVLVSLIAALVLCTLVKGQLTIPRFHFPFFVLFSAVAAVVFSSLCSRNWPYWVVGIVMFACALVPLFYNSPRPILSCGGLERASLERRLPRGREIMTWLERNNFIYEGGDGNWYLADITDDMWGRLMLQYPVEFKAVWVALREPYSFSRGIFSASREEAMFFGRFGQVGRDEIGRTVKFMKQKLRSAPGCRDIGYEAGVIQYEYPLWSILNSDGRNVRVEHIEVHNASERIPYPRGEPDPCLIVVEGNGGPDTMEYKGQTYRLGTPGPWQVYVKERN